MRAGVCAVLLFLTGCWTIRPPANVKDPVPIFVADYGVHSAVLVPAAPGMYIECSFGDWPYTVGTSTYLWDVPRALLFSSDSAFGVNYAFLEPGDKAPKTVRVPNRVFRLEVERDKAAAALAEIHRRYDASKGPVVYDKETGRYFVHDPTHYSLLNNCNTDSANLLRIAGCKVSGVTNFSDFVVLKP